MKIHSISTLEYLSLLSILLLFSTNQANAQDKSFTKDIGQSSSVKEGADHIVSCHISMSAQQPATNVVACYINFNPSALEVISIQNISPFLAPIPELSNLQSLTMMNQSGQIDAVMTRTSQAQKNTPGYEIESIFEIKFRCKSSKISVENTVTFNTEFPRKTSLAFTGNELEEVSVRRSITTINTGDRSDQKNTTTSAQAAREELTDFQLELTLTMPNDEINPASQSAYTSNITVEDDYKRDLNNVSSTPNPFNSTTTVFYELNREASVQIEILNQHGLLIKRIPAGRQPIGKHRIIVYGQELPAGIYFCRLLADTKPLGTLKLIKL